VSKGPDAFRTISEVAEELNLPQHVLRFWETRFSQIRPMKRGGGRRYYRPDDIDLLRGIRHLLYGEGYTIRGVQRILREQGARSVAAAGRGEPDPLEAGNGGARHQDAPEPDLELVNGMVDADLDVAGLGEVDEDDDAVGNEPAFDPRDFRGAANGHHDRAFAAAGLAGDEVDRLKTTLADLLELKRLLDQAR
jgi:DNA-binding transcriptional MerR regulator